MFIYLKVHVICAALQSGILNCFRIGENGEGSVFPTMPEHFSAQAFFTL